jgi:hypothetical protein
VKDFERLMLAVYDGTVETSKPFVSLAALEDQLKLDPETMKSLIFTLTQRSFLSANAPGNKLALSESGIAYVERNLKASK